MRNYKKSLGAATAITISVLAYLGIGCMLDRANFWLYFLLMSLAFGSFTFIYRSIPAIKLGFTLALAIGLRLLFLFSMPALSDDYHRFVWDGEVLRSGESPYKYTPAEYPDSLLAQFEDAKSLRDEMNSPNYYSVYPPLNQGVFLMSSMIGRNTVESVITIRLLLIIAEGLIIFSLFRIGRSINRRKAVLLYALNPLVITEVSGNLHFEGIVALFILVGLWALFAKRNLISGFLFGTAAAVKLTPFIYFSAILLQRRSFKQSAQWLAVALLTFAAAGWWIFPIDQWLQIGSSIGLYFQSFEFNASFYYLTRAVGMAMVGYNPIATTGWLLPTAGMMVILFISFRGDKLDLPEMASKLVLVGTAYLLFATTVHPWYLIPIIALSVLSRYTYPIVWSFFIALSYSAYDNPHYSENGWLIALEYAVVLGWLLLEFSKPKLIDSLNQKIWGETP